MLVSPLDHGLQVEFDEVAVQPQGRRQGWRLVKDILELLTDPVEARRESLQFNAISLAQSLLAHIGRLCEALALALAGSSLTSIVGPDFARFVVLLEHKNIVTHSSLDNSAQFDWSLCMAQTVRRF